MDTSRYSIIIENPKGSYKSFEIEDDPTWSTYPLKGVTYPVDYGSINGYIGEDGDELDVFVGTGSVSGFIKVWRLDVAVETKFFFNVTDEELNTIVAVFGPVLIEHKVLEDQEIFAEIEKFKIK